MEDTIIMIYYVIQFGFFVCGGFTHPTLRLMDGGFPLSKKNREGSFYELAPPYDYKHPSGCVLHIEVCRFQRYHCFPVVILTSHSVSKASLDILYSSISSTSSF